MFYDLREKDPFDAEDQRILDRAAARLKAANAITPQPVVDPWEAWANQQAEIFSKCLDAAIQHMPDANAEDKRYAATVLYGRAATGVAMRSGWLQ